MRDTSGFRTKIFKDWMIDSAHYNLGINHIHFLIQFMQNLVAAPIKSSWFAITCDYLTEKYCNLLLVHNFPYMKLFFAHLIDRTHNCERIINLINHIQVEMSRIDPTRFRLYTISQTDVAFIAVLEIWK